MDALSGLFGKKPKKPQISPPARTLEDTGAMADTGRRKLLEQLGKRRRATMMSNLTEANIKRNKLGAG